MGGEWLKMRVDLWDDPRVVRISSALDADKARTCGALFRTWALADQYTIDGRLVGYTPAALDAAVGIVGWSQALEQVGWLTSDAESVQIPRFTEHNGQSAKRRASDRDRKKRVRNLSASHADTKRPRKEKREMRNENPPPPTPSAPDEDGWEEVEEELRQLKIGCVASTIAAAHGRGLTPADVLVDCRTYRDHARTFDGAGALVHKLREGEWPRPITAVRRRDDTLDRNLAVSRLVSELQAGGMARQDAVQEAERRIAARTLECL